VARVGSDKSKIASVTVYLANMIDFDAMNAVYGAWVDKANPPVRACVEAGLAGSEFNVEIAVVAER
jgi:enamine deaminase RidA (YjgF/YER057c/UK114 family)